ncbi:hypothetical protein G7Y89_g14912 [Cudoniella acicularis]|uniref:Tat pathway signal sequence n=1 Tax=Cudoniella acicularis TaxID=354080 RepID=A0A8H4VSG9_9HELO|nr:hypothetical protein G7Y89_g14912 [Cudoniella acicularis]
MYTPLEDRSDQDSQSYEDNERLFSKKSQDPESHYLPEPPKSSFRILLPVLITALSSLCAFWLGTWAGVPKFSVSDESCISHVQKYSPILKEVDTSLHIVHFNGSFMKGNAFRKDTGPEVDAAWESMGINYRSVAIPVTEAAASGIAEDQVQINPKYGGGFPANVEGLHHLHCLNLLRQTLYFNYDYYHKQGKGAFVNEDHIVRYHVTHCLDIIRQQLMCMPNTGVLGQIWWDRQDPKAFVDFNTEHKCKNFEAIRKWAEERQIPDTVPEDFLQHPIEGGRIYDAVP